MSHQVPSRCPPQPTLPPVYEVFVGRQPIYTANAAIYTRTRKVVSIHQALQLVGLTAMTNIVRYRLNNMGQS